MSLLTLVLAAVVLATVAAPKMSAQVAGSLDPLFTPNVEGDSLLAAAVQPDDASVGENSCDRAIHNYRKAWKRAATAARPLLPSDDR